MTHALIGHTGFVGGTLWGTGRYDVGFNSKNFRDMEGQSFDTVTCAGVQAQKWWANQNPQADWDGIAPLLDVLGTVKTRRMILISSVDVYQTPVGVDENSPTPVDGHHPYGLHRLQVEDRLNALFDDCRIIRLPGLYGAGLKKNLIFDTLMARDLSGFDARSEFQFYHLKRLQSDIDRLCETGIHKLNLATEPVSVKDVIHSINGQSHTLELSRPPVEYDMRTCHGGIWGQDGLYLVSAKDCLADIAAFADEWRREHP
ncbi:MULTISPECIES: NAD(P)-dependent oxidoreductase [unclassified Ruegeria]|uniref:NAD(P)-dependent oxidoreductase n=1 Tax=unclassified Ruegeria TaxID=2625375 RepID=UPI001487BE31|nr:MULTISPECIES: NAD(P)-dependent oxidoreductase [unclassified Ruegeria]